MPSRATLAGRIAAVVTAVMLATSTVSAPASSQAQEPARPPAATGSESTSVTAIQTGLAKVVGPPMEKTPPTPAAFAPEKGSLHPRIRAAYENAERVAKTQWPRCGLRWTIIAAVGAIESAHGTHHDGATVLEDSGRIEPPIIGLPLDGRGGRGRILDTDNGVLDGNTVYDHAVGPLQFIPDTWARHGVDANGDGVADPHSIDDAALAAASYLCTAAGGNLRNNDALYRAFYSYNHSDAYVLSVRAQLDRFDRAFGLRPNPPFELPSAEPPPPPPPATTRPPTTPPDDADPAPKPETPTTTTTAPSTTTSTTAAPPPTPSTSSTTTTTTAAPG